jgi:hypothetical protein
MRDLVTLHQEFWSQFHYNDVKPPYTRKALPAYQEGFVKERKGDTISIPDFPYIVYPVPKPNFSESVFVQVNVWDRPPDGTIAVKFQDRLLSIVEQIEEQITADGALLLLDSGAIRLKRGNPWINILEGDPSDPKITRAIITVIIENHTM